MTEKSVLSQTDPEKGQKRQLKLYSSEKLKIRNSPITCKTNYLICMINV